mgnify:CR=1 FL=1
MKKLFALAFTACLFLSCSDDSINEPKENAPKTTDTANNYYSPYDIGAMMPIMVVIENHSSAIFQFHPCFNIGYFDGNETDGLYFGNPLSSYPNIFNLAGDEYRQQIYGNLESLLPGEGRKYSNTPGNAGLPFTPNTSYFTFSLPGFSSAEEAMLQKFGKLFYLKYQFVDPITLNQYGGAYLRNDPPFTLGSSSYDPTQYAGMSTPSLYPFIKYYNMSSMEVFEDDYYAGAVDSNLVDSGHTLQFKTYANYIHIEIF